MYFSVSNCTLGKKHLSGRFSLWGMRRRWRCWRRSGSLPWVSLRLCRISCWTNDDTQSLNTALWTGIPGLFPHRSTYPSFSDVGCVVLVAFSSFAVAANVSSKPLTADIIFPAISLFMLLSFPLAMVTILSTLRSTFCTDCMNAVCCGYVVLDRNDVYLPEVWVTRIIPAHLRPH